MSKVWLSWSTGKDSAWALNVLRMDRRYELDGLFTTVTHEFDRVSVHGVRVSLLEAQADKLGLPLHKAVLPWPCSNKIYEQTMDSVWETAINSGVHSIAFGDLFLEDVRQYRVNLLNHTGLDPIFPIWGQPTQDLAEKMIESGLRAAITCVNPEYLPEDFAGRQFDAELLDSLPPKVDPCGENGEFHTFCHTGPMFSTPIHVKAGEVVNRSGFVYADLLLCAECA